MNIKNIICGFLTLLTTACNNQRNSTFIGCWELVSATAQEEGKPKQQIWEMPYELIINENGKCYFLNTHGVLFDSAQWVFYNDELKFSKSLFTYQNRKIERNIFTIESNNDSVLVLKTQVNEEGHEGSLEYSLQKKTYSGADLIQKFKPLYYTIQDHIRNCDQNSKLKLIAERLASEVKDPQIFLLTDSVINILEYWRYRIPDKSGGYRYPDQTTIYFNSAATVNLYTCHLFQKADFLRLHNKICNYDTISSNNLRPIIDSLMLRNYFSNNWEISALNFLNKTPYKIKVKVNDDNVIQLLNDIEQSKTMLWINCIEALSLAPKQHKK